MRNNAILTVVCISMIAAATSYWAWKTQYDEQRPINMALMNKHMETFIPKYRREECLVRIDFTESSIWTDGVSDRIFRSLMHFVAEERPKLGPYSYIVNPRDGHLFIQFTDDCPNRFEHMQEWTRRYARRHGNPSFTVSNDIIKPGPDTLDHQDDAWLD